MKSKIAFRANVGRIKNLLLILSLLWLVGFGWFIGSMLPESAFLWGFAVYALISISFVVVMAIAQFLVRHEEKE